MKKFTLLMSFIALMFFSTNLSAQTVLFEDNFDAGNSNGLWTIGQIGSSNTANLAFDYITAGIPAAPNGGGLGMKLEVNTSSSEVSQISTFPKGETFTGTYTLSFDMLMSYEGSSGSTELALFGIQHTSSTVSEIPSANGLDFGLVSDGSFSRDIKVYKDGTELQGADGGYAATGSSQDFSDEPYYSTLNNQDTPLDQWLSVVVEVTEQFTTLKVNGVQWAQIATITTNGNIISLGYMDLYTSIAPNSYIIYDNVKIIRPGTSGIENKAVETFSVYPNPANDILNIKVNKRSNFELIDITGKTIMSQVIEGTSTIELGNINKGMYFAKVTQDGNVQTRKVIIR